MTVLEFVEFHTASPKKTNAASDATAESRDNITPEEMLESAHQQIRIDVAASIALE